jgi:energy-coupling factor transporter ATP-binding protein EcfA2
VRLTKLYLRFFRSFNFDYERKAKTSATPQPWEQLDGAWFPFVQVPLDHCVTAIVGANESGKSHLIDALRQALTGEGIERVDFCRYSSRFSVESGRNRLPDLGVEVELVDDGDVARLESLGVDAQPGEHLTLLRLGDKTNVLLVRGTEPRELDAAALGAFESGLPTPFALETSVALPDTIAFDDLLGRTVERPVKRRGRFEIINLLTGLADVTQEALASNAGALQGILTVGQSSADGAPAGLTEGELARRLLIDVAKIDHSAFEDLEQALLDGKEGQVGGLIEQINQALARHLNFNRWWTQDADFRLEVESRERELAFTIRDRTGTAYSFEERSRGLKYFLSYFIQLRAHHRATDRNEILLMDEPDAYLSSVGQQDLLRTLEAFAEPDDGRRGDQVVYVTHSPFLINRNAAHRIRVLDKGSDEEGTRVVRDVARNHYEPLRSSLGGYVAETAFVGGTNLLVEGVSDQVLLAGASALLRSRGIAPRRLLNLNEVTIVPSGSAAAVPYMAYLARGRDEIKPACVALLDGDKEGLDAATRLARSSDGSGKEILSKEYVLVLSEWAAGVESMLVPEGVKVREMEDLIPPGIAAAAARRYASHLLGSSDQQTTALTAELIEQKIGTRGSVWKAVQSAFQTSIDGAHIEKVGFAKEVIRYLESPAEPSGDATALVALEHNFAQLLAALAERLAQADLAESERRTRQRSNRVVRGFLRDHQDGATRDAAEVFLRELEAGLEFSQGDDAVRNGIGSLRHDFELSIDPLTPVAEFARFRERVEALHTLRRTAYHNEPREDNQTEVHQELAAPQTVEVPPSNATAETSSETQPEDMAETSSQ